MGDDPGAIAETVALEANRGARTTQAYLLVISDGSSFTHHLSSPSVVTIGRDLSAELRVDHSSVSRRHARIQVDRGEMRLSDLDSRNGTRVNGMRIDRVRALVTGDVITIGEVLLVVHAELERELSYMVLDEASWRRRLAEETERAVMFQRSLAVLSIAGGPVHLGHVLRAIDVVGQADNNELLALLPEADPVTARQLAVIVLEAVREVAPQVRIGISSCPTDATDPDNLILAARAAAGVAVAGGIATAVDAARRIELGDREVLVCHPAMASVFELLSRLARSDLPVLIVGETGVGKENAAFALHHYSERRNHPFIALNCAALPESLVESQLFGHDKGAFTGATSARAGLFETVSGGTLFLDEIGELAPAVQAKLLRALETKRITRVGETKERAIDLRIVAATHRVLEKEVADLRFREDLYFRLVAARVDLLPLRDRRCEIPMLFRAFIARAAERANRPPPQPDPQVMQCLLSYAWPGNVRELKNVADFVMATVEDDRIALSDLPPQVLKIPPVEPVASPGPVAAAPLSGPMRRLADELEELERQRMLEALARTGGVKTRAAAMIGMPIRTFNMKIKQYRL
jgi:DNA-binding NtrC family response regulator